jgi:hypothetical protein
MVLKGKNIAAPRCFKSSAGRRSNHARAKARPGPILSKSDARLARRHYVQCMKALLVVLSACALFFASARSADAQFTFSFGSGYCAPWYGGGYYGDPGYGYYGYPGYYPAYYSYYPAYYGYSWGGYYRPWWRHRYYGGYYGGWHGRGWGGGGWRGRGWGGGHGWHGGGHWRH